jgi:predicted polyphosphate/ATP-dependent NAD kinase
MASRLADGTGTEDVQVLTVAGEMGEVEVREAGLVPRVAVPVATARTTGEDTTRAAVELRDAGARLLLFAGGDGTARDVCRAVRHTVPVVGIPAGVKMYSSCYAITPTAAGDVAAGYLRRPRELAIREVLDLDEAEARRARVRPRLHCTLLVPADRSLIQGKKAPAGHGEADAVRTAAAAAVAAMQRGVRYVLGPGGTTAEVARQLGVPATLIGVDVVEDGRLVAADVSEAQLLELVRGRDSRIVVTAIGGQGFLLGRGNQQISAAVVREVGPRNLVVVCDELKLLALEGRPLLVDTGDRRTDELLTGYVQVMTAPGRTSIYPVRNHD